MNSFRASSRCDIYISGSNSRLLSGELATLIAGRYIPFTIQPFVFSEWIQLQDQKEKMDKLFEQYLLLGGMPYPASENLSAGISYEYLRNVFDSVILKDIVKRNSVRDVDLLQRMILYCVENDGRTFSASSIVKYLKNEGRKSNVETIQNYLRFCQDAYLVHRVKREDAIGKKIFHSEEKYYLSDIGLRQALFGRNMADLELILENIVHNELKYRGWDITFGKTNQLEIDFIGRKEGKKVYIQVAYILGPQETRQREFRSLLMIPDNYPKLVLSLDTLDFSQDGIIHKNLIDFLLNQQALDQQF